MYQHATSPKVYVFINYIFDTYNMCGSNYKIKMSYVFEFFQLHQNKHLLQILMQFRMELSLSNTYNNFNL